MKGLFRRGGRTESLGLWWAVPLAVIAAAGVWEAKHPSLDACSHRIHLSVLRELRARAGARGDLRTLALVIDAQRQVDEWNVALEHAVRSGGSITPEILDDIDDQIRRIRDVYVWTAVTPELSRSLILLADLDRHRFELLREMRTAGFDEGRYACLNRELDELWSDITGWGARLRGSLRASAAGTVARSN